MTRETTPQRGARRLGKAVVVIGLPLVAALIGMLVLSLLREAEEWEAFAERRHCRVVGYMRGNKSWPKERETKTVLPSAPEGPDDLKTGYACDDGFTYWR